MNKQCPCCGSETLLQGDAVTAESLKLFFVANKDKKKLFPKSNKIMAFVCSKCGNVSLYVEKLSE